jgi:MraZ protein
MAPKFLGNHEVRLDSKGRVSIPAPFRSMLVRHGQEGVVLFPSYKVDGAIEGCSPDFMDELIDSVTDRELFSDEGEDLSAQMFNDSAELNWDSNGRVVLPQELIEIAGLTDAAIFAGNGRMFRIFEPQHYTAWKAARRRSLKEKSPSLVIGRGRRGAPEDEA